ncbi:hypothetical protein VPHF86_0145 [Vibrio phage F86]
MDITGKIEINPKQFVNLPWSNVKTHVIVGQSSEHINERFNQPGEIETSNINYIDIVGNNVYAITHSKSRYLLTNVSVEEVTEMVAEAKERDINIAIYTA